MKITKTTPTFRAARDAFWAAYERWLEARKTGDVAVIAAAKDELELMRGPFSAETKAWLSQSEADLLDPAPATEDEPEPEPASTPEPTPTPEDSHE
jgi:hypothetical protein